MSDGDHLQEAARALGLDLDGDVLLAIVHRAFAPRETMTAEERRFMLESGAAPGSFDPQRQAVAKARLSARATLTARAAAPRIPTREVADLLRCKPERVRRLVRQRNLFAIRDEDGRGLVFPTWQFLGDKTLPGLRELLAALPPSTHALSFEGLMTTGQEELNGYTPIRWLADGGAVDDVVSLIDAMARG